MGPTCVLSAPDGHHVGPMNLALKVILPYRKVVSAKYNPGLLSLEYLKQDPDNDSM